MTISHGLVYPGLFRDRDERSRGLDIQHAVGGDGGGKDRGRNGDVGDHLFLTRGAENPKCRILRADIQFFIRNQRRTPDRAFGVVLPYFRARRGIKAKDFT